MTVMLVVPVDAGETAVIDVPPVLMTYEAAGTAPNITALVPPRLEPARVTDVPPAIVPLVGDTEATKGPAIHV